MEEIQKAIKEYEGEEGALVYEAEVVTIPFKITSNLFGKGKSILEELEKKHMVNILTPMEEVPPNEDSFCVIEGKVRQVGITKTELESIIAKLLDSTSTSTSTSSSTASKKPHKKKNLSHDRVHVFVDWSNIAVGAGAKRLNISKLIEVVEKGRNCVSREVAGFKSFDYEPAWINEWKKCHYNVKLGLRKKQDGKNKEVFVDEALHSMMLRSYCDYKNETDKVAVLLTGDGNDHESGTATFPMLVGLYVQSNWKVEIWSWKLSLHHKFLQLAGEHPGRVTVHYLDYEDIFGNSSSGTSTTTTYFVL